MFGSLNSTKPTNKTNEFKTKKYFKDNQLSGLYQDFDPYTGKLKEQGNFSYGYETGKWRVIDEDGDEIHYSYSLQRVGAICNDGTTSTATGRGACSWHGGVAQWLQETVKSKIGGTGKYVPIEQRVQKLRREVKDRFKINKSGLQFQLAIFNMILDLADEKQELFTQVSDLEQGLQGEKAAKEDLQLQLEELKTQIKRNQSKDKQVQKQKAKLDDKQIPESQKTVNKIEEKKKEKPEESNSFEDQETVLKVKLKVQVKQGSIDLDKYKKPNQKKKAAQKEAEEQHQEDSSSDEWASVEDERERGQKQLIKQLFQKMNLK